MIIKSIKLKNIRSYIDEEIKFPHGSTLLTGDIGSGKSTVLLALDFALFGLRRGELDGSDLLRHGEDYGYVELEFEIDGKNFIIRRALKREKNRPTQDSGYIIDNNRREDLTATELKSKVLQLLGYPKEMLTKNPIIFRYTVYTPQEQMKRIFQSSQERMDTMRKIFGIDKYGRIKESSKILISELRAMKREIEISVRDLDDRIRELNEKDILHQQVELEINRLKRMASDADYRLETQKTELEKNSRMTRELDTLKTDLEKSRLSHSIKSDRMRSVKIEYMDAERYLESEHK